MDDIWNSNDEKPIALHSNRDCEEYSEHLKNERKLSKGNKNSELYCWDCDTEILNYIARENTVYLATCTLQNL